MNMVYQDECPLCGAAVDFRRLVTGRGTHFSSERAVHCLRCGLVFLNPRMSEAGLAQFYLEDTFSQHFRGAARPDSKALQYRDGRAGARFEHVRALLPANSRVLEIGCSCGSFVRVLLENGHRACGIDPSTGYAQFAREQGLDVFVGRFPQDLPEMPPLDAVALFHVIEHVHSPRDTLIAIRELLNDDGRLLIEYPDVELALERSELRSEYFQKSHLHDFSAATMTAMLAMIGFQIVHQVRGQDYPYDKNMLMVAEKAEPMSQPVLRDARTNEAIYRQLVGKLRRTHRADAWQQIRRAPKRMLRRLLRRDAA